LKRARIDVDDLPVPHNSCGLESDLCVVEDKADTIRGRADGIGNFGEITPPPKVPVNFLLAKPGSVVRWPWPSARGTDPMLPVFSDHPGNSSSWIKELTARKTRTGQAPGGSSRNCPAGPHFQFVTAREIHDHFRLLQVWQDAPGLWAESGLKDCRGWQHRGGGHIRRPRGDASAQGQNHGNGGQPLAPRRSVGGCSLRKSATHGCSRFRLHPIFPAPRKP